MIGLLCQKNISNQIENKFLLIYILKSNGLAIDINFKVINICFELNILRNQLKYDVLTGLVNNFLSHFR